MTRLRIGLSACAAVLLHVLAVWLLLPHAAVPEAAPVPDTAPAVEIEMVQQDEQVRGAPPETGSRGAPPAPPSPSAPPVQGTVPLPPPAPAAPPPGRPAADMAAVNLGNADEYRESLLVTGDNVVPPRPDATFHNRPPDYPAAAARRGIQGTVTILIHVTTAGVPGGVEVLATSGDASLDRAAVDAAALWRFEPARNNGVPVPFDYRLNVSFKR